MTTQDSRQLIARLQGHIHDVLAPLIPPSGCFGLLDFPDHGNVGDSAIWLGEIEYFRRMHKLSPAYVSYLHNTSWQALERFLPKGPIFLHGGGNFGDLWPSHQEFREAVLERFRDRAIIQLPQSLHFSSSQALSQAAAIIRSHRNFTLLVRDRKSLAIASEHFSCKIHLCPDMAFCIGPLDRPLPPTHPLLLLLRTDHEQANVGETAPPFPTGAVQADWLEEQPHLWSTIRRHTAWQLLPALGLRALNSQHRRVLFYRRLAQARLARGLQLLSSAEFVITDRLHAHILCTLLNTPHIMLDNNYGKLSSFAEAWTQDCDLMHAASNVGEALARYIQRSEQHTSCLLAT
jgi:exopolysaccharide biosynthesis predicted pyruvyltransferase EpsI